MLTAKRFLGKLCESREWFFQANDREGITSPPPKEKLISPHSSDIAFIYFIDT